MRPDVTSDGVTGTDRRLPARRGGDVRSRGNHGDDESEPLVHHSRSGPSANVDPKCVTTRNVVQMVEAVLDTAPVELVVVRVCFPPVEAPGAGRTLVFIDRGSHRTRGYRFEIRAQRETEGDRQRYAAVGHLGIEAAITVGRTKKWMALGESVGTIVTR